MRCPDRRDRQGLGWREPEAVPFAPTASRVSKSDLVVTLLKRGGGTPLDEMVAATGWLPHTTRAALTGLK